MLPQCDVADCVDGPWSIFSALSGPRRSTLLCVCVACCGALLVAACEAAAHQASLTLSPWQALRFQSTTLSPLLISDSRSDSTPARCPALQQPALPNLAGTGPPQSQTWHTPYLTTTALLLCHWHRTHLTLPPRPCRTSPGHTLQHPTTTIATF